MNKNKKGIEKINRSNLPFRKNCEGYFFDKRGNILAKNKRDGFLTFPGGGVNDTEDIDKAIIRETFEETGAIIKNLKKVGELKFIWGKNWAKSKKQRKRYLRYKGEDMHFFVGEIAKFSEPEEKGDDFWDGQKLIPIKEAIGIIESKSPFDEEIKEYRKVQLKFLRKILNELFM